MTRSHIDGVRKPWAMHVARCVLHEEDGIMVIPEAAAGRPMAPAAETLGSSQTW